MSTAQELREAAADIGRLLDLKALRYKEGDDGVVIEESELPFFNSLDIQSLKIAAAACRAQADHMESAGQGFEEWWYPNRHLVHQSLSEKDKAFVVWQAATAAQVAPYCQSCGGQLVAAGPHFKCIPCARLFLKQGNKFIAIGEAGESAEGSRLWYERVREPKLMEQIAKLQEQLDIEARVKEG